MPGSRHSMQILLTASEAYPALERAFLASRNEIWASFLVFDLTTDLRSAQAQKIGRTWFDLVAHTLARGVELHFVVSDVDGVARPKMHRDAWRTVRMFKDAAEVAGPGASLTISAARHPAESGWAVRLAAWRVSVNKLRQTAKDLNAMPENVRAAHLLDMPDHSDLLKVGAGGKLKPRLWPPARIFPLTHHQKLAVIDRQLLYIGGLDLNERRYDTPEHHQSGAGTWHDVQLMIQGPVVAEAQAHLEGFLDQVRDEVEPPPSKRLLRTLSTKRSIAPFRFGPNNQLSEIRTAHFALIRRAERLIYLETQYFRDRKLALVLARRARDMRHLTLILVLPAAPDEVAFEKKKGFDIRFGEYMQARSLKILRKGFGDRLLVVSPAQRRAALSSSASTNPDDNRNRMKGAPLIYVHAKVSVFDGHTAVVSSANLNGRSMLWDTECGVYLSRRDDVADLRQRVMTHWIPEDAGPEFYALETAQAAWAKLAHANAAVKPEKRRGFLLPYDLAAAEAFGRASAVLPEEMV